ncbi:MAG: hypothetical protein KTR25_06745 [Myxococcales bacterium]|nr:hypothetical protein [Myxococcales bacterium]
MEFFCVEEDIWASGQPSVADFEVFRRQGGCSIICLREEHEPGHLRDVSNIVKKMGMIYCHHPTIVPDDIHRSHAEVLGGLLESLPRKVLIYCKSANRVGGLLALWAYFLRGSSVEEALAYGRKGGMLDLELQITQLLRLA